ncbi:MAG: M48 family metallopeptidase [Thermoanaerobaculia bacterium]|nr:M48 family metallopeptidase [Thermoanaerobaculia bacterium]
MHVFGLLLLSTAGKFDIRVTEEMIRHSRIRDILYFAGFAYGIGVLLLVLASGISSRLRDTASRVTKKPFIVAAIFTALFVVATFVLELPLSFYSGYVVPHQFNLSNQDLPQWLGEQLKGLAISIVLSAVAGGLVMLAIQRIQRWWLAIWLGSIPITIFMVVVTPIFIDPVFNDFQPLKDQVLAKRLLDMAGRAGIEGSRVYQVDKSRQTKTMNAYVTGIGPTKRIVMWDTLLAKMSHDEVVAVMGHEMGHYVLHHLWKGIAFGLAIGFVMLFLAHRFYELGIARWGARWRVDSPRDPAALPWLLVLLSLSTFLLSPAINSFSRWEERQADTFGLQLTGLNEPMATAFIKLAENSKANPYPHPFIEFWRYSHPSIGKRVKEVLREGASETAR